MQKIKKYIPPILLLAPLLALAQDQCYGPQQGIFYLICRIIQIVNYAVPLLIALAMVIFLWGVVQYITAGGAEEKRAEARNVMIWGIIGLFVMVSVWGLVNVLYYTFNLDTGRPAYPSL